MSDFDPYHIWLGISPQEQPAHYYRLLGITDFEDNREVISAAAEQRTIYLRTVQAGEHAVLVAELLNEVSQARVTLLNVDQKASYDEQLRKRQAPEPDPEPTPVPIPVVQTPDPTPVVVRGTVTQEFPVSVVQPAKKPRRRKPKEVWKRPAVIGVCLVGVIGVLVLFISMMSSGDADPVAIQATANTLPTSLREGLVAYYPFNGNANDESGNGHHGTVHGATLTQDRHDNANRAYLFNEGAEASNVVVPDHDLLDLGNSSNKEITISLWCSLPKHKAARLIVKGKANSPVTDYCLFFPTTTADLNILFWGTGRADTHSGSWPPTYLPNLSTEWHHLVAIYKQGKGIDGYKKVYLDGQLIYLGTSGAKNKSNSEDLLIGGRPWTAKQKYLGHRVDDVRIYNRALSEAEVKALYEFEKP